MEQVYEIHTINSLKEVIQDAKNKYKDNVAYKLKTAEKGKLRDITYGEAMSQIDYLRNNVN